ncbi:hypothetical protein NMG60_11028347, partial [Bertholletia excelsa]
MSMALYNKVKPYFAVIFFQLGYAELSIIVKFALDQGVSPYTFNVYRNVIAAIVFAPFAIIFEKNVKPQMTVSMFSKIMFLGLLEPVVRQNLYYVGVKCAAATFTTAMSNVVPALTFVTAWIVRLENVNTSNLRSQAKVVGTVVTVGGAMMMTFIKGAAVGLPWNDGTRHEAETASASATQQNLVKGSAMITAGCLCWAVFFILQTIILKSYPAQLSLTTLVCMAGALQGVVATFVVERGNLGVWSLGWDSKPLAYLAAGDHLLWVGFYISGVVIKERGRVFYAAFSPLELVVVIILSSFILAEQIFMGGILGAGVTVVGLDLVAWGKSKDE